VTRFKQPPAQSVDEPRSDSHAAGLYCRRPVALVEQDFARSKAQAMLPASSNDGNTS